MWDWLGENSVWLIFASGLLLLLLILLQRRLRRRAETTPPGRWHKLFDWLVSSSIRVVQLLMVAILLTALVALIICDRGISGEVTLESIQAWLLDHGTRLVTILAIGVGLWLALQRFLPGMVRRTIVRTRGESTEEIIKRSNTLASIFMGTGKVFIVLIISLMFLSEVNLPITPVLASLGVVGVAVGFGAQSLIKDIIAGLLILAENQYRVGDVARVADVSGLVEEIKLRKTVLRDLDGTVHHVPNGEIRVASNFTRQFSRVNLNISVAYDTDLERAISIINRVGKELAADKAWSKHIITPPQALRVDNLGDSGIDIKIMGDVKPIQQWAVTGELRLRLKKAFDAEKIEIPWPHTKVYFGNLPALRGLVCRSCSGVNSPGSQFCSNCGKRLGGEEDPCRTSG